MSGFIIKRLLWGLFTIWIISIITFGIFILLPSGDPAARIAGKAANDPAVVAAIRHKFHFDQSKVSQYTYMMTQLMTGKLESFSQGVPVMPEIWRAIPKTLSLAFWAAIIWLSTGVTLGIVGALNPGSKRDTFAMVGALTGISLPIAWLALVMLWLFSDKIPIFPAGGYETIHQGGVWGWAYHLLLPATSLAILFAGIYTRMTRSVVLQALDEEHVKTAIGKGLPWGQVFERHVLRTALIPVLVMLGMDIGLLLGGAIFTESIYGLSGLGYLLFVGIQTLDVPILLACTLIAALFVVLANLAVDLLQAVVDPRIRLS